MSKIIDAPREAALDVIKNVERGAILQDALSRRLGLNDLTSSKRNFCADLVYGYFRTYFRLRFIMERLLRKPEKLPQDMRILLLLALYSLFFQSSPPHLVLHNTVEKIKKSFGAPLARVANGVLRSAQRLENAPLQFEWYNQGDEWQALSIFYSLPLAISNHWRNYYGLENAQAMISRAFMRPWTGININDEHQDAQKIRNFFSSFDVSDCLSVGKAGFAIAPGKLPDKILSEKLEFWEETDVIRFHAPASMLILEKLGLFEWKKSVWDCCAGMGGKSRILLSQHVPVSLCSDVSIKRLQLAQKLISKDIRILAMDAASNPLKKWDGNILVDAPCTGLGVLARRPDLRLKNASNLASLLQTAQKKQIDILNNLVPCLNPGNQLAYVTCSLSPLENEQVAKQCLISHPELEIVTRWTTPHDHPWLEGMYGIVFQKKSGFS